MNYQLLQGDKTALQRVARRLCSGEIGIFPCDTVLGLISTFSGAARIRSLKKRRKEMAFILLVDSIEMAKAYTQPWTDFQTRWISELWPGPISVILEKSDQVPDVVTGSVTVGLRLPASVQLRALITAVGAPIVSTSVNISGEAAATVLSDVSREILDQVDFVYEEQKYFTLPSCVVDLTMDPPRLLRSGRL